MSESAEALAIRQAGESSILASIAGVVSQGMTEVLRWVYWWDSTEDILALVQAWQAGALSRDTLHQQFQ